MFAKVLCRAWPLLLLLLTGGLSVPAGAAPAIPPLLRDWTGWVMHGHEQARCPGLPGAGRGAARLCAWPGKLELSVDAEGASFSQTWEVLEFVQEVPLPGDARWRPEAVTVDGRAAPVLLRGRRPSLSLSPGSHRVAGRIVWTRRPAALPVPDAIALIDLRVDGRTIERIERDGGVLALGEAERFEADSLGLDVVRLLADGVPGVVLTHLRLSVAGRPRELRLGPALPAGYAPMAIYGGLPARLDADGRLRVQLRPGEWDLTIAARALAPLTAFSVPVAQAPWPEHEVLQFRPDPRFRLAQLTGLPALDPSQFALPDWDHLSEELLDDGMPPPPPGTELQTLRLTADATATLEVRQRGLPDPRPPQLSLQRTLWLDFDGGGYSALDRIQGESGSLRRLDMAAPWRLQRVNWRDRDWLITRSPEDGHAGFEIRDRELDLSAAARVDRGALTSGWNQPFSSARFTLNLPPGYRLLAAIGAERALGSWWDGWSLLDIFLASLAALLAWRLGRWPLLALAAGFALLAWHEPGSPRQGLLIALALALAMANIPAGRWLTGTRVALGVILLALVLAALPFAAGQLKLGLYPQLEYAEVGTARDAGFGVLSYAPPAAPPAEPARLKERRVSSEQAVAVVEDEAVDRIEVTGSRARRADLFSYPADAIPQAGSAMPDWSWRRHELHWSGPLLPADDLGLWLSPPWLTRIWRLFSVLLLAGLLAWLARSLRDADKPVDSGPGTTAPAQAAALLPVLLLAFWPAAPALAQAATGNVPDAALLDALRDRLLERREPCQPDCVGIGPVLVTAEGRRIEVDIEVQAQADGLLRLPRPDAETVLVGLLLDGASMPVRRHGDDMLLRVSAGVRQVRAVYAAAGRASLRFADPPARVRVRAPGFRVEGLDEGRLTGDTLALTPPLAAAQADAPGAAQPVPPFVRVLRTLDLGREWNLHTEVRRVAPASGGFEVVIALLPGERILDEPLPLENGKARVALAAGEDEASWRSRLTPSGTLALMAAGQTQYVEEWRIHISPLLHAGYRGLPLSLAEHGQIDVDGGWIFLPMPGEQVELAVSRPAAVEGATLALEDVRVRSLHGGRASEHQLGFDLRATRAGDYRLALPDGAELLSLSLDGNPQPGLLSDGAVVLPLAVGVRRVDLSWRQSGAGGRVLATPELQLGASSADLRMVLELPQDRWLLWLAGPGVGPALLLWSQMLVLIGLAWALGRWGGTPLRMRHWLLLGLGFAMVSWPAAVLIAGWLLALGWRGRKPLPALESGQFNLLQLMLAALSVAAVLTLLAVVPAGLLGRPDMGVVGNGSSATTLNWFLDRSADGQLPAARAYTLPLWLYKAALLAWSLWLAQALLGWLRWGWQCYGTGGAWRKRTA